MIEQISENSLTSSSSFEQTTPTSIQNRAKQALLDFLRSIGKEVDPNELDLIRSVPMTWNDPSLGCPEPGHYYPQVLTPGFCFEFQYRNEFYSVHSNESGSRFAIA